MQLIADADLRPYNSFAVSARARYLALIDNRADLQQLISDARLRKLPRLILGAGSNVLFKQDFAGVIAVMQLSGIALSRRDADYHYIRAAAGENWHHLVQHTIALGYAGLENLSLIPGTVGAAPVQNIGAYGVELSERFASLEAVDLNSGECRTLDAQACQFAYRSSVFKTTARDRYAITSVTFKLPRRSQFVTDYSGVAQALNGQPLSAQAISDAVCALRQSKLPDPATLGNAGSFFKNPLVGAAQFADLQAAYPQLGGYPQPDGRVKLSAAWLIDQCGWKGQRSGDAGVYSKHALVLVNHGSASGSQLWQLAQAISRSVQQRFGVALEPEPLIV